MSYKKKLIEVALPLEAINNASAREKSIRHGHPSTLHLWWARRPLAACRAVLFSTLVDDPSSYPEQFPTAEEQGAERNRLFSIIEEIVKWENSNNKSVLDKARAEIIKCSGGCIPAVYDPFCGGGSIPLEAQRLGLIAQGTDINPVAVIISKALIEIPSKFTNRPPVNPQNREQLGADDGWQGAAGLADDVRFYGRWMKNEAEKRLGKLYPKAKLQEKEGGSEANVIAWIWARTVKCPNPACGCAMPLVRSFSLSTKKGKETWLEPKINNATKEVQFLVKSGKGKPVEGTVNRRGAKCICCGTVTTLDYIREQGREGKIKERIVAQVLDGKNGRVYVEPDYYDVKVPDSEFLYDIEAARISGYFNPPIYGYSTIGSMFNGRQRYTLETFADLVQHAKLQCLNDGKDEAYAAAIATYLTLAVGRLANRLSSFSIWNTVGEKIEQTFSEQGVGMVWDYAEANPFSGATGSWEGSLEWIPKCLENVPCGIGTVEQWDAADPWVKVSNSVISTDPPYFSSITYADFADYFYGIFRRALKPDYQELFATMATPKEPEIVAAWHRFDGDKARASEHFRNRLKAAVRTMVSQLNEEYPATIYYAFKEREVKDKGEEYFTAWESILGVLIEAGLKIVCTWPLRTERITGRKADKNVLASSIVLVCRKRDTSAVVVTRREFISMVKKKLQGALKDLQQSNIPPVDLAQSSIGPGMEVFSGYSKVLEANGEPMSVRAALAIINQEVDSFLSAQEGAMDEDTRFCISWFEQFRMNEAAFGEADKLARAKNTSVERLVNEGLLLAGKGKVCLVSRDELNEKWNPEHETRITTWRCTQQLVKVLLENGEDAAALLIHQMGNERAERAKSLTYRLYAICERKGWAEEGFAYNILIVSWTTIQQKAANIAAMLTVQGALEF